VSPLGGEPSAPSADSGAIETRPVPPRQLWLLALGFGVWCSATAIIYALQAVGCDFAWSAGAIRLGLGLALFVHLAVIGWLWRDYASMSPDPAFGPTGSFLHWVVVGTVIAAFVATAFTLGPSLLLTLCM
jgi:hypothetical protein